MRFSILLYVISWSAQVVALPHMRDYAQVIHRANDAAGAASIYAHSMYSGKNPKPQKKTERQVITQRDYETTNAPLLVRPFLDSNGVVIIPGNELETPTPTSPQSTPTSTLAPIPNVSTAVSLSTLAPITHVSIVVTLSSLPVVPDLTKLTAAPTQTTVLRFSTMVSLSALPVVPDVTKLTAATTQTTVLRISATVSSSNHPIVSHVTSQSMVVAITQTPVPQNSTAESSPNVPVVPDVTSQSTVAITKIPTSRNSTTYSSPTLPVVPNVTSQSTLAVTQIPVPQNSTTISSPTLPVVLNATSQFKTAVSQTPVPQNSTTVSSATLPVVLADTSQFTVTITQTPVAQNSTANPSPTHPVVQGVTSQFKVAITQTPIPVPRNSTAYSSPTLPVIQKVTSQFKAAITQTLVPENPTAESSPTLPVVSDVTHRVTITRTVVVCGEESSPTLPVVAAVATKSSTPTTSPSADLLRGVNLGGWLVLEKWMNADTFTGDFSAATDEWSFSQIVGAGDAIKAHWETFFTEADIQAIAATGINALRIPIGFWAYDNENTPYIKGADVYLERAIGWARKAGLKVWIDCHGSPGSQNGFDHSGHAGDVQWQQPANLERTILVLKTLAAKYGTVEYADVVVGLQLLNEPISWGANELSVTKAWAKNAHHAVKSVTTNPDVMIVMHDAFEGALAWADVAATLNDPHFAVDTHMYHAAATNLTQAQHIAKVCSGRAALAAANAVLPTFVGEWSAATDICVNADGSTTPGTACSAARCQCQSADPAVWNARMVEQVRRFVEAQLDVFEASASGYFMWSAKAPGAWGFLNGIKNGAIPNPVTSRKYPGQCGGL